MEELHSCIIHVGETSNGNLKHFTPATFSIFRNSRKIWLSIKGLQTDVAVKSLEYCSKFDEEVFENEGTVPTGLKYHIECYRKFTDKEKIERAQRLASATVPETSEPSGNRSGEPAAKKLRQLRKRSEPHHGCETAGSSSTPVLPRICLICKKKELIYTCPVSER